jgi:hypothetical protein
MAATFEISVPDTLVKALETEPDELPRQTLEALIVQAFRKGQITHAQVGELLELKRFETDGFLKNAQAFRLSGFPKAKSFPQISKVCAASPNK